MCGRYFRNTPREEIAAGFRAGLGTQLPLAYNVAPGQLVMAVRFNAKTGERTLDDLQWGLIPHFAKDTKIAWKTINARAETIDTAASYRTAFIKRRYLIVADGFFEWKALTSKKKQPYAIALHRKPWWTTLVGYRSRCCATIQPPTAGGLRNSKKRANIRGSSPCRPAYRHRCSLGPVSLAPVSARSLGP